MKTLFNVLGLCLVFERPVPGALWIAGAVGVSWLGVGALLAALERIAEELRRRG